MRAKCRRKRHKARCGHSDPSSGERSNSNMSTWRYPRCGRRSGTFGMRPSPPFKGGEIAILHSTSVSRAGRDEKSFSKALPSSNKCVLPASALSAALLREGPSVRVHTFASDNKPKSSVRALGTEDTTLLPTVPFKRRGDLLSKSVFSHGETGEKYREYGRDR